ncbi:MAG: NFACT family protein [Pyrinomonadaceae bacterium]
MTDESRASKDEERLERIAGMAGKARQKVRGEIRKAQKLIKNLQGDLESHGDPDRWKLYGDLLLANVHSATRTGDTISVTNYFDEAQPRIDIEGDANSSLSEVAEGYFRRYAKARNARTIIAERIAAAEHLLNVGEAKIAKIDLAVQEGVESYLIDLTAPRHQFVQRPT